MAEAQRDLIRLVALACNDVRTPMATLTGFVRTLAAGDLGEPAAGYARTIAAAAEQIDEIVAELGLVARIEEQRYEPVLRPVELAALLERVAGSFEPGRVGVRGTGTTVLVDERPALRALGSLVRTTMRNGALDTIEVLLDGPNVVIEPVEPNARPVVAGDEVREFGAAAALRVLVAQGARCRLDGSRLVVSFRGSTQEP